MTTRPPDAELPLSYLYAEYADKCRANDRTPLSREDWKRDPAHPPSFRDRPDVIA